MPGWPKLTIPLLADLAEQLRFAPKAALVKDIQRTIETIGLIQPETPYPAEWIAFRVTGYRTEQMTDPLLGSVLKPQLARLVERLSAQSRLSADDLRPLGPGFDQPSLLKRWNISRKSLERYRARGLIAVRVLSARGRSSLFFPKATTEAFESAQAQTLKRAAAFSRIDQVSRAEIRERAAKIRERASVNRSRLSSHLAKRTGRSRAAIERALPAPRRSERRPRQSNKAKNALLARWESGISTGELARQARKSRPAIVRALNLARQSRIENWDPATRLPLDFNSKAPNSLADLAARSPRAASLVLHPAETDLDSLLAAMRARDVPDRTTETELVLTHHACMQSAAANSRAHADAVDLAETALRWAAKLRAALVRPHRAVIVASLESLLSGPGGIDLLRSEPDLLVDALFAGVRAASTAIEGFTPLSSGRREIGGTLAAPIALHVARALSDWTKAHERELRLLRLRGSTRAARAPGSIPDWTDHASPWQATLSPARLRSQLETRPPELEALLRLRFGWASTRPHTISEIAKLLNLTRIRAASQLQHAIRP